MGFRTFHTVIAGAVLGVAVNHMHAVAAIELGADFSQHYNIRNLGSLPGLPTNYGGLVFQAGDPNTIIIGGNANRVSGRLYEITVIRDATNHIVGFNGDTQPLGSVGEFNDGGVAYGPGGVLFTARYPTNSVGQTLPGGDDETRVDELARFGVGGRSISALNFIPPGFPNAGAMKIVTFNTGRWYDVNLAADGGGTYDITDVSQVDLRPTTSVFDNLAGGPEGFVYISDANQAFEADSMLISAYSANSIHAYEIDRNGDPILPTRRVFIKGLSTSVTLTRLSKPIVC